MAPTLCAHDVFRSGSVVYRRATPGDDADIRTLLRDNPMKSWVKISLEREPLFLAGEHLMGRSVTIVARDEAISHRMVGLYSCRFSTTYVNGQANTVGYLANLRVHPAYRRKIRLIKDGFASIPVLLSDEIDNTSLWFTSIAMDNTLARRLLEANLPGMPIYLPHDELVTFAIDVRHGKHSRLLRPAEREDIPVLAHFYNRAAKAYQFAPVLNESWLHVLSGENGLTLQDFWLWEQEGTLQACFAVWDQRMFKQTRIHGYAFPLSKLRPIFNIYSFFSGYPVLPGKGEQLEQAFLSFAAFAPDSLPFALDIIRGGLTKVKAKNAKVGILGLTAAHPLASVLKKTLKPYCYHTCIEQVFWPGASPPVLRHRICQPEASVL